MNNKNIIHRHRGTQKSIGLFDRDQQNIYLDFDDVRHLTYPGNNVDQYTCPKCQHASTDFYWNVATQHLLQSEINNKDIIRIQHAEYAKTLFYCAFCLEPSTANELDIVPFGYIRMDCISAIDRIKRHKPCHIRMQGDIHLHDVYAMDMTFTQNMKKFYNADFFILNPNEKSVFYHYDKTDQHIVGHIAASFITDDVNFDTGTGTGKYKDVDIDLMNNTIDFKSLAYTISQKFGSTMSIDQVKDRIIAANADTFNKYITSFSELVMFFLYEVYNHPRQQTYTQWFHIMFKDDIEDGLDMNIMHMPEMIDNYKEHCKKSGNKAYIDL